MSVLPAFADALEKWASSDLEDVYARQHARDAVADLQSNQKRSAYAKDALIGAAGASLLPGTMGVIGYVQGAEGRTAVVDQAKDLAKVKAYLVHKGMGGRDPDKAASDLTLLMQQGQRTKNIGDYLPLLRTEMARDELKKAIHEDVWGDYLDEIGTRNSGVARLMEPPTATGTGGARTARLLQERGRVRTLNGIATPSEAQWADVSQQLHAALAQDPGMAPVEAQALRARIEQHAKANGVKFDAGALKTKLLKAEANKVALSMLPFALIGAMGGIAAVRMKRKKLEALQRDAQ